MPLCLRSPLLSTHGFRHGFSLRDGGVGSGAFATLNLARGVGDDERTVAQNLSLFAREVGFASERLYELTQVHGGRVEQVDQNVEPALFQLREADALVSGGPDQALAIRVADCVPVLLADPISGAVAAAHAGWRGVVAEVVPATVRRLVELTGSAPEQLLAAVFPCIGVAAFEVGEDVAEQLARAASEGCVESRAGQRPHADLALAVSVQLAQAGLPRGRVDLVRGCTFSEPSRFFSYRRDQGRTGRHLAAIVSRC